MMLPMVQVVVFLFQLLNILCNDSFAPEPVKITLHISLEDPRKPYPHLSEHVIFQKTARHQVRSRRTDTTSSCLLVRLAAHKRKRKTQTQHKRNSKRNANATERNESQTQTQTQQTRAGGPQRGGSRGTVAPPRGVVFCLRLRFAFCVCVCVQLRKGPANPKLENKTRMWQR